MLLIQIIYSHGQITNLPIRQTVSPIINPVAAVFTGKALSNVSIATGAVKTAQQMQSNLNSVGSVFSGAIPCRYNSSWNATNKLTQGPQDIVWEVTESHPNSTCVFNLLKNGQYVSSLSDPFACAAEKTSSEKKTITIPTCSADDKCTIQWYWSADAPIAQFINCVDFVATDPTNSSSTKKSGSHKSNFNLMSSIAIFIAGFLL